MSTSIPRRKDLALAKLLAVQNGTRKRKSSYVPTRAPKCGHNTYVVVDGLCGDCHALPAIEKQRRFA